MLICTVSPTIRVRTKTTRYAFDGDTGVLVIKGTPGTIDAMTLVKPLAAQRAPIPKLTVFWDACVLQDKANDEPSTYDGWQESDVDPDDLEFLSAEAPKAQSADPPTSDVGGLTR